MADSIDQASLDLIIELQLQDIKKLTKGKHKEGERPDGELAAELYRLELQGLASFQLDKTMSRSMAHAVLMDGEAIRDHMEEEEGAVRDRNYARNGDCVAAESCVESDDALSDALMIERLAALNFDKDVSQNAVTSPSKKEGGSADSKGPGGTRRCVACLTDILGFEVVSCPCSHDYCRACIADLFQSAMNDESLFPPRCCSQPIPVDLDQIALPAELVEQYWAKELEYTTEDRTYCHIATCSTFVPPQFIEGEIASCVKCNSKTCTICKGSSHNGDCPKDAATLDLLTLAAENGWQRCNSCRRMVELNHGCYHITCPCSAQFCYLCGLQWKTCSCAQWDEVRLLQRANAIVDRVAGGYGEIEARAAQVEHERINLIQNHDCVNHTWGHRRGRFRCDECYDSMPLFIYECRHCRILACRRCRHNRL